MTDAHSIIDNSFAKATPDTQDKPNADWVRGICPQCGAEIVSSLDHVPGHGYLLTWECWQSRGENPKCSYRRVL